MTGTADPSTARVPNYERLASAVEEDPPLFSSQQSYTVEEAISHIGVGNFQYGLLAMTGLCWTAESMEMLLLSFIKAPLQCQWHITDPQAAMITTSVGIGMLLGATSWGLIGDRYGRRVGFIASTVFTAVFGVLSAFSVNHAMLVVSRGLTGFGIGGVPVSFSLMMEFLPVEHRGTWGMGIALFWSVGAIFESAVAMYVIPNLGWRWLIVISSIPLFLVLLCSYWLTESPRWLISKGHVDRAQAAVDLVATRNNRPLPPGRLEIPDLVHEELRRTPSRFGQTGELWRRGARSLVTKIWFIWFVSAFIYYGLITLQPELMINENSGKRCHYAQRECAALPTQERCATNEICSWKPATAGTGMCGIPSIARVARADVPEAVDSPCTNQLSQADFRATLGASVGEMPGLLIAFATIDTIGRRPVLGYMLGGVSIGFVLLLACLGRGAEALVFFIARGLSSGVFQTIYIYTNEVYPAIVRTTAMGLASSMARIGLITTPFVSQYLVNNHHAAAMWIYFATSALAVFGVILLPIETTRRPLLSSMDELIEILRMGGDRVDNSMTESQSFAKDPSASWWIRMFRWRARVDGLTAS